MIFVLVVVVLYLFVRVLEVLLEFLHPLSYDSKNRIRFHKKYTVFDLLVSVQKRVLGNLTANCVLSVSFNLLAINQILMSWFVDQISPAVDIKLSALVDWQIDLIKTLSDKLDKFVKLIVASLDHEVDHSHDLRGIVCVLSVSKGNS